MKPKTILKDQLFKEFLDGRNRTESTKTKYEQWIRKYCNYMGKTPTELIEEAEDEEDAGIRMRKRKIRQHLLDLVSQMEAEGKSPNHVKNVLTVVKGFYKYHEIQLPANTVKISRENGNRRTIKDVPSKDVIREVLKHSNLKYKAIILLMSSSGMGNSEVRHLTYGDFLNSISEYYEPPKDDRFDIHQLVKNLKGIDVIGTWKICRYKTKMEYTTFNTPEATTAILDYLRDRIKISPITSEKDFLFVSSRGQMSERTIIGEFNLLNDRCDLGRSGHYHFFTSHKLRKFFASTLISQGLQQINIDWMLGHAIDEVTEAYFKGDISALKKEYLKIVDDLSIEKVKVKTVTTKEYDQLLRDSMAKDDKIAGLEKRMELMEKLLSDEKVLEELNKR